MLPAHILNMERMPFLKVDQALHKADPLLDILPPHPSDACQAKAFAAEGGYRTAVNDGSSQVRVHRTALACQITQKSAHKGIARTGRVHHFAQRKRRGQKQSCWTRNKRTVLAFFDNNIPRAQAMEFFESDDQVVFLG